MPFNCIFKGCKGNINMLTLDKMRYYGVSRTVKYNHLRRYSDSDAIIVEFKGLR